MDYYVHQLHIHITHSISPFISQRKCHDQHMHPNLEDTYVWIMGIRCNDCKTLLEMRMISKQDAVVMLLTGNSIQIGKEAIDK